MSALAALTALQVAGALIACYGFGLAFVALVEALATGPSLWRRK